MAQIPIDPGVNEGNSAAPKRIRLPELHRLLAWVLPAASSALTIAFFVALVMDAPLLTEPSFGRHISRGIIVAIAILGVILVCVWVYGLLASALEKRMSESRR